MIVPIYKLKYIDKDGFMEKQEFLSRLKSYLTSDFRDSLYDSIDYWYPLQSIEKDIPAVAFDLDKIYDDGNIKQIEEVFCRLSIDVATVIQNQEDKPKSRKVSLRELLYESDLDGWNFPWYVESYYYDTSKQWMIYTSHEFTITFAGETLARTAKQTIDSKYMVG